MLNDCCCKFMFIFHQSLTYAQLSSEWFENVTEMCQDTDISEKTWNNQTLAVDSLHLIKINTFFSLLSVNINSLELLIFLYKCISQILTVNYLLWLGSWQLWSCWRWWWGWWGWRHVLWQWWVDVTTMMTPVQQSNSQNYFDSENICHNQLTVFEPQFFMICWSLK